MDEPLIFEQQVVAQLKSLEPAQKEQVLAFIEFLAYKNKQLPKPKFGSGKGLFEMSPDFDTEHIQDDKKGHKPLKAGFLKGTFTMKDDFDEPLDDFKLKL